MSLSIYQEKIYGKRKFGKYFRHRFIKIFPYLKSLKNPKILDLGCGEGQFYDILKEYKTDFEYVGVDISKKQIAKARKKGIYAVVCDISKKIPFRNNTFDVIIATEIIEHLFDTTSFLKKCNSVLKKEGLLILTTPNIASLGNRINLLFGKRPGCIDYRIENSPGHIRAFVRSDLKNLVEEGKFKIIGKEFNLPIFSSKTKITFLNKILCRLFPTLSSGFILIAKCKK